ncbi:MAG TPA: hypothetical protein VJ804_01235 [Acidimicrobiales bacterium]|nr:hypothetical protein [Acidimicrobiales bacterium]
MAVLLIGEIPNLTEEMYAPLVEQLRPVMQSTEGFVAHVGGPNPDGGWRVIEVWDSEEQAQSWFEQNVKPNLPPGVTPNRTYHPIHTRFTAAG